MEVAKVHTDIKENIDTDPKLYIYIYKNNSKNCVFNLSSSNHVCLQPFLIYSQ